MAVRSNKKAPLGEPTAEAQQFQLDPKNKARYDSIINDLVKLDAGYVIEGMKNGKKTTDHRQQSMESSLAEYKSIDAQNSKYSNEPVWESAAIEDYMTRIGRIKKSDKKTPDSLAVAGNTQNMTPEQIQALKKKRLGMSSSANLTGTKGIIGSKLNLGSSALLGGALMQ
jgi:hypothetical protein